MLFAEPFNKPVTMHYITPGAIGEDSQYLQELKLEIAVAEYDREQGTF